MSSRFEIENINASVFLQDDDDFDKRVKFDISRITTGNDRIITVLDENLTLVGETNNQTLTNKTIDVSNNTIINIENTNIKLSAAIDASKIANGSVSNTEFEYLNGVSSSIQTQIDNHTTNTNNPHNITKSQVGLNNVENLKVKLDATIAPIDTNDSNEGYSVGSRWIDITNNKEYVCLDNTIGTAIWNETTIIGENNTVSSAGGTSIFKEKTGVDLVFKGLTTTSTKISLTSNTNDIGFDVNEENINIQNLSGAPSGTVVGTSDAQTLTKKTLTNARIDTALLDINGNEIINVTATSSAVNEVTLANAATDNGPTISATGDDTNIDLNINSKGTGNIVLNGQKWPTTDGNANQVLKTDGVGNLSYTYIDILTIDTTTTTDATEKTISTIPTSNNHAYLVEANIIAISSDSGNECDEAVAYRFISLFKNNGGTITKSSEQKTVLEDSSAKACNSIITVSGANILIKVKGIKSKSYNWKSSYKITNITTSDIRSKKDKL